MTCHPFRGFLFFFGAIVTIFITNFEVSCFDTIDMSNFENKFDWSMHGEHVYIVHALGTNESSTRYNSTHNQLSRLGLLDRTTFHSRPLPIQKKGDGHFGCWKSHQEIAKNALSKGYKRIIVLEDDIIFKESFLNNYKQYLQPVIKQLSTREDWEVFYFTHNIFRIQLLGLESWNVHGDEHELVKVKSWSAVGYAIQSTALWWLAHSAYFNLPGGTVDGIMHYSRAYALYPMPATHPDNWSRTVHATRKIKWKLHEKMLYSAAQECPGRHATQIRNFENTTCDF